MKKIILMLSKIDRWLLDEFFSQIIAAIILLLAFISWSYFSSIYAAITVVIICLIIWGVIAKLVLNENK